MEKTFLIFLLYSSFFAKGQECQPINVDLICLQGLWEQNFVDDYDRENYEIFQVADFTKSANFSFNKRDNSVEARVFYSGFIDSKITQKDTVDLNALKLTGKYFIVAPEPPNGKLLTSLFSCTSQSIFCHEGGYEVGSLFYLRRQFLPKNYYDLVVKKSKIEKRDYIAEFNINKYTPYRNIATEKTFIHSEPNRYVTDSFFKKGENIEVLEEDSNWIKVRAKTNKKKTGWIRKTDVM